MNKVPATRLSALVVENRKLRTRLKTMEEALQSPESDVRFRAMVDNAVDGIFTINSRGIIESVNPAAERIFGYSANEMLGRNISIIMPKPDSDEHDKHLERYQRTGERHVIGTGREAVGMRKNGELFPIDLAIAEARLRDRIIFIGTVRDITARKNATEEMKRIQLEAVEANKAKDDFIAMLSHELRNPLSPILIACADYESDSTLAHEVKESFRMIRRNVEVEAQLVDDLLDVTRIARGKVHVRRETVDLHQVLEHVAGSVAGDFRNRHVSLTTEFKASRHFVSGDPARLKQVIWNLVKNALKFSGSGASVFVYSRNPETDAIQIEVSDTGIGIESDTLLKIFDPFEQGKLPRGHQFGGLGLGLAISKGLVEMHGGKISAHSAGRGCGATFLVDLPLIAATMEPVEPAPLQEAPPATKLKILVVEDNRDNAATLGRILKKWGHKVSIVHSFAEAVELGDREQFEVLVSDIGLPDGNGWDLMRRLPGLRGIAVSGYGMEADIARSREAGFATHLSKPISLEQLRQALAPQGL